MSTVVPKITAKRPPQLRKPRTSRYSNNGLTIDWFEQKHENDTRWPYPLPDWWTYNLDGATGVSYCMMNAKNEEHIAAFKQHMKDYVKGHAFEVLEFEEDLLPKEVFPYCNYHWIMMVDDKQEYRVDPSFNPKVSIIMGTYRRQHIIGRTVQTLLDQDHKNWELIIINNEKGGKVNLPADHRIRIYNHTEEANPCYAKNCGYQYVTGDLVCAFDDDNDMLPGYLSKMAAPFADPKVKVVRCGMRLPSGVVDFSYDTQEAWLRVENATPTWTPGSMVHDQLYYRGILEKNRWQRRNIIQLGEVLIQAYTDPKGGMREGGC